MSEYQPTGTDLSSDQNHSDPALLHETPAVARDSSSTAARRKRVVIEATKLLEPRMDGVKRYVVELILALADLHQQHDYPFEVDVSLSLGRTYGLQETAQCLRKGSLPANNMPSLLRHDATNPLGKCQSDLAALESKWSWQYARLRTQTTLLKSARSFQKRWYRFRQRRQQGPIQYDLVHVTLPNTWHHATGFDAPAMVTVHDLCHRACPQFQNASNRESLERGLNQSLRHGAELIAVSESTREQLLDWTTATGQQIRVVPEACDHTRFFQVTSATKLERVKRKYGIPDRRFVLSVGTLEPRKNVANAIRAFRLLKQRSPENDTCLVIGGARGWGDHNELKAEIENTPDVYPIGYIADADMAALYSAASVFCYVSHYEGFGLPILEAMACGVPVVYGNNSSMPEVAGDCGMAVEATDVAGIADHLQTLLEQDSLRQRLGHLSMQRAQQFHWQRVAAETLQCYADSLAGNWLTADTMPSSRAGMEQTAARRLSRGDRRAA